MGPPSRPGAYTFFCGPGADTYAPVPASGYQSRTSGGGSIGADSGLTDGRDAFGRGGDEMIGAAVGRLAMEPMVVPPLSLCLPMPLPLSLALDPAGMTE